MAVAACLHTLGTTKGQPGDYTADARSRSGRQTGAGHTPSTARTAVAASAEGSGRRRGGDDRTTTSLFAELSVQHMDASWIPDKTSLWLKDCRRTKNDVVVITILHKVQGVY